MHADKPLVLWITTGFPPEISGPAVGNLDRARWFAGNPDMRVVILAPAWPGAEAGTGPDEQLPEVIRYPSKRWIAYRNFRVPTRRSLRFIEDTVARLRPDLILLTDVERSYAFAAWRLPGRGWATKNKVPYIGYYHTDFYNFAGMYPVWRHLRDVFIKPVLSRLYRGLDAAICPSPSAAAQARFLGAPRAYTMRFDGVDTGFYRPDRRDRHHLKRLIGIEPPGPVVLSLGRLAWEKRIDLTIDAVGRLQAREEFREASLVVAGGGDARVLAALKRRTAGVPRPEQIHFVGPITGSDKADLIASCDVLCLPSPYETFGITATEAMASGLVVLASDSGALPDYLDHGRNGYLHRQEDVHEIARLLGEILSEDQDPVRRQAIADVQRFSMETVGTTLAEFFQAVLDGEFPQPSASFSLIATGESHGVGQGDAP